MNNNVNNIITIAINKLTAWEGNVRKTDADSGIDELAASIASHGLLQSLVVTKGKRGKYLVIAGRRRYLALKALAKSGAIESDMPVPCSVAATDIDPAELSLAENIVRMKMHPADQFEAFRELIDKGASVTEVAARFSIAESVVTKRLKLGRLSPAILAAYRGGDIGLEQAQAFALSDDHAEQEKVLDCLSGGHVSPAAIRRALTEGEVPVTDSRVRFIGLEAYIEAGGAVRRDLFDQENSGFVLNEALLEQLVVAKLEIKAEPVRAEGWRWVEIVPDLDYATLSQFSRRYPGHEDLPEDAQAELDALTAEYEELSEDDIQLDRLEQIDRRIDELNVQAQTWPADTLAMAGVIVGLRYDGSVRIERGLVRKEDERAAKAAAKAAAGETAETGGIILSAPLTADLTAQKTAAIRTVLAGQPDIALACIVHTLAGQLLYRGYGAQTCLEITVRDTDLRSVIAKPDGCRALISFEQECERWAALLPGNPADLWSWCLAQPSETLLSLLALCTALSVDAVQRKSDHSRSDRLRHADALARALTLDMSAWFTPDAENFFGRINRTGILAAIREAKGVEPAPGWTKLKKAELAQIAAQQVADTGWLPAPLRIADGPLGSDDIISGEDDVVSDDKVQSEAA